MRYLITTLLITSTFAVTGVSYAVDATSVPVKSAPITTEEEPSKSNDFIAGEIIIVFEDNVTSAAIETLVEGVGGEIAEVSAVNPSRVVVSVPEGQEEEYVNAYSQLDDVRTAEKNYVYRTQPESGSSNLKTSVSD
jgi:hypothetical protein